MTIYIISYIFTVFGQYIAETVELKKISKLLLVANCILLILLAGLRDVNVGVDTVGYYEIYNTINSMSLQEAFTYIEPLWVVLNKVAFYFDLDAQGMIFLSSLFCTGLTFIAIQKYSPIYSLSIGLYLSLSFYFSQFNVIRQAISCSILLLACKSLSEKNIIKFAIICFIAAMVHYPAILFIFTFFLVLNINNTKRVLLIFWIISIPLIFDSDFILRILGFFDFIYGDYYLIYVKKFAIEEFNRFGLKTVFNQIIFISIFYFYNKIKLEKYEQVILIICLFSIVLDNLFNSTAILARISMYWTIFQILAIPIILNGICRVNKKLIFVNFQILVFLFLFYVRLLLQNSNNVVPY